MGPRSVKHIAPVYSSFALLVPLELFGRPLTSRTDRSDDRVLSRASAGIGEVVLRGACSSILTRGMQATVAAPHVCAQGSAWRVADHHLQPGSSLVQRTRKTMLSLAFRCGLPRHMHSVGSNHVCDVEDGRERAGGTALREAANALSHPVSPAQLSLSLSLSEHALSVTGESGPANALFDLVPEWRDMDARQSPR